MLIYIALIFNILFFGILFNVNHKRRIKKIYTIFIFLSMSIVTALRSPMVGADTMQYYNSFLMIKNIEYNQLSSAIHYELGFSVLCKLLNYITPNPQILIVITSVFIIFSFTRFIYMNSANIVMSFFIFISLNYYFSYMNIMRQALAIAILLFGYEYLKRKKYVKYCLVVYLASQFHLSASIAIVLIIFSICKFKKKSLIISLIIAPIFFLMDRKILQIGVNVFPQYTVYIDGQYDVSNYFGSVFLMIISLSIFVFVFINFLKYTVQNGKTISEVIYPYKNSSTYFNEISFLQFCASADFICSILVIQISFLNRIAPYFSIFAILTIPKALEEIKNFNTKKIVSLAIILITLLYWIIITLARPEWYGAVPYSIFIN